MVSTIVAGLLVLLGLMINALFTGLGSAIGSYLANKHLIKRLEQLNRKQKRK